MGEAVVRPRLDPVDRLRGLVMVLMALDHVRDFMTQTPFRATDLSWTTVPLFFTRWITHYCAPTFVFLTGAGVWLYASRGRSKGQVAAYLVSRGVWIVFLEFTVVSASWRWVNVNPPFAMGGVLWAIGASMVILAGLIWLPRLAILAFGVLLIAGHNAFDGIDPKQFGSLAPLWQILHTGKEVDIPGIFNFSVGYPLIPWVGVMAVGYAFGPILQLERSVRLNWILALGAGITVAFFAVRAANVYGDPIPWTLQRDQTFTVLSFLNCWKYPPSLSYLLMTLGPMLLVLAALEWSWGPLGKLLTIFGRVPMFYYLIHVPLILGFAYLFTWAQVFNGAFPTFTAVRDAGGPRLDLVTVYVLWIVVVAILFFPCRWFAGVKQRHPNGWLSYL